MDAYDLTLDAERERRRSILLDPPAHEPEPPGYLAAHGVHLEAVGLVRHADRFYVVAATT